MDVGRRRTGPRSNVVAGSVRESRMKSEEASGEVNVSNKEESNRKNGAAKETKFTRSQSGGGMRKPTKSENAKIFDKKPVQRAEGKIEATKKKSTIQGRKLRSDGINEELRTEVGESSKGIDKNLEIHGEAKLVPVAIIDKSANSVVDGSGDGVGGDSIQFIQEKTESGNGFNESRKEIDLAEETEEIEKIQVEIGSECDKANETSKDFGVYLEQIVSSGATNVDNIDSATEGLVKDEDSDEENEGDEEDEDLDEELEIEIEEEMFDIKKINIPEPKKTVNVLKKFHQIYENPDPSSFIVKNPPPILQNSTDNKKFSTSNGNHSFPGHPTKFQGLVDLVMWRDVSRSAFAFGIGTFVIISSSYTKDINISFLSVMSYLGLLYLAVIFLYRSIICRRAVEIDEARCVVGEEEAIWVLRVLLPYLNESLLKLRALFCGDPATTMKLAVLLFVLARCGCSITIWKVVKWGFFGGFTVPRICSSYSTHFISFANYWVRRFRDTWNSCSNKKGVALIVFTLIWNLSSTVTRIWTAFMLFVAIRYYQQSLVNENWTENDDVVIGEETCQGSVRGQGQGCAYSSSAYSIKTEKTY